MPTDAMKLADEQIETRPVAADAYLSKHRNRGGRFLTHSVCVIGDDWVPLCKRVASENLVYCVTPEEKDEPPSCPICLRRDPRFKKASRANA